MEENNTNKPDYKRFGETFADWNNEGIPYGMNDLVRLAKSCNTPLPGSKEWEKQFPDQREKFNELKNDKMKTDEINKILSELPQIISEMEELGTKLTRLSGTLFKKDIDDYLMQDLSTKGYHLVKNAIELNESYHNLKKKGTI